MALVSYKLKNNFSNTLFMSHWTEKELQQALPKEPFEKQKKKIFGDFTKLSSFAENLSQSQLFSHNTRRLQVYTMWSQSENKWKICF